mgnify:CR=1 FL=1
MQISKMFLEIILLDDDLRVENRKIGKMPFVIDSNGYPHQLINQYLSYEVLIDWTLRIKCFKNPI